MSNSTVTAILKNTLNRTVLRKSKYLIEIPLDAEKTEHLSILCQNATFPEKNITKTSVFHKGRAYNLKGEVSFGDNLSFTFLDTASNSIRYFFDKWLNRMEDITNGSPIENADRYMTTINLWQLGCDSSDRVYGYIIYNCFPISMSSDGFDATAANAAQTLTVNFSFSEYEAHWKQSEDLSNKVSTAVNIPKIKQVEEKTKIDQFGGGTTIRTKPPKYSIKQ